MSCGVIMNLFPITWIFTDMVAFLHFGCHVASEHAQCVYHIASSALDAIW